MLDALILAVVVIGFFVLQHKVHKMSLDTSELTAAVADLIEANTLLIEALSAPAPVDDTEAQAAVDAAAKAVSDEAARVRAATPAAPVPNAVANSASTEATAETPAAPVFDLEGRPQFLQDGSPNPEFVAA